MHGTKCYSAKIYVIIPLAAFCFGSMFCLLSAHNNVFQVFGQSPMNKFSLISWVSNGSASFSSQSWNALSKGLVVKELSFRFSNLSAVSYNNAKVSYSGAGNLTARKKFIKRVQKTSNLNFSVIAPLTDIIFPHCYKLQNVCFDNKNIYVHLPASPDIASTKALDAMVKRNIPILRTSESQPSTVEDEAVLFSADVRFIIPSAYHGHIDTVARLIYASETAKLGLGQKSKVFLGVLPPADTKGVVYYFKAKNLIPLNESSSHQAIEHARMPFRYRYVLHQNDAFISCSMSQRSCDSDDPRLPRIGKFFYMPSVHFAMKCFSRVFILNVDSNTNLPSSASMLRHMRPWRWLRKQYFGIFKIPLVHPSSIYSQPHALIIERSARRIHNLDDVRSACTSQGFNATSKNLDVLPLQSILSAFSTANTVVGVHGAGLTWILFGQEKNVVLIELLVGSHRKFGWYAGNFDWATKLAGFKHIILQPKNQSFLISRKTDDSGRYSDVVVDMYEFKRAITIANDTYFHNKKNL